MSRLFELKNQGHVNGMIPRVPFHDRDPFSNAINPK